VDGVYQPVAMRVRQRHQPDMAAFQSDRRGGRDC
jgi:hypothetical protein